MKTCWLVVLALAACDQGVPKAKKPPEIKNGLRMTFSIAQGSPEFAAKLMQRRLDIAKIKGNARAEGSQIVVDLAAASAETIYFARVLITRRGKLDVDVVDDGSDVMRALAGIVHDDPHARDSGIDDAIDHWRDSAGHDHDDMYFTAADREERIPVDEAKKRGCYNALHEVGGFVQCNVSGRQAIERYLVDTALLNNITIPEDHDVVYERLTRREAVEPTRWRTYYVKNTSQLGPNAVALASAITDHDTHAPIIEVKLLDDAAKALGAVTAANVGRKLTLIIDGRVQSAPIVMEPITGGRVVISLDGGATKADAAELALALTAGPLPGPVREESVYELANGKVIQPADL